MRFKNKVALITAGANGIGRATARIMASEGATVIVADNHQGHLDEAVPSLQARPPASRAARCRASWSMPWIPSRSKSWSAAAARDHGAIDILVNAVGGSTVIANPQATTEQLSFADWQKLIAFNLDATFLCTHTIIPVMKKKRSGKIVNLASIAGRGLSYNSSSAYAAAKGGIIAFTRKLAFELGPDGINVNAIAPSITLDRAHPPALGQALAGLAGRGDRTHAVAPRRRGGRPGQRHLFPGLVRRRFRHGPHHRRHGRCLAPQSSPRGRACRRNPV